MEESTKKPLMLGIIVVCLVGAGAITWKWSTGGDSSGIQGLDPTKMTWVLCRNEACAAEYQMSEKDYYMRIDEERMKDPSKLATPGLICKDCGKDSLFEAEKCQNPECGVVFETAFIPKGEFGDKCPKCGYSKLEETAAGGAGG
jgi:hypothetical protein